MQTCPIARAVWYHWIWISLHGYQPYCRDCHREYNRRRRRALTKDHVSRLTKIEDRLAKLERLLAGVLGDDVNAERISVTNILGRFPNVAVQSEPTGSGVVGVQLLVFTNDGNNYVPTVLSVASGAPAARAGVKAYDMILAINGVQVVNKPFTEVIDLLGGDVGTP